MKLADFDYILPDELIAQDPAAGRDESRLLVLDREKGNISHKVFKDLNDYLRKDDVLVVNDTKVFKARLIGRRKGLTGKIEVLLTERIDAYTYAALVKPSKKFSIGTELEFGDGLLCAKVIDAEEGFRILRFSSDKNIYELMQELGNMPLPPYIKRPVKASDEQRYQTVYARHIGAIAAPTAGLHFTQEMLEKLRISGVDIVRITLHVGYATFKPVTCDDITNHKMHKENFSISEEAAEKINTAKQNRRRIIAVGTTVCRALESSASARGNIHIVKNTKGNTDLFIYPGYEFKIIDALLTNFHLPRTSLLLLVSAFAGRENILKAYQTAVREKYRFFSYGDAMLIM